MAMSQKQYVKTAEIIKDALATANRRGADPQPVVDIARDLASMFANDNPRFDWNKFLTAAGIQ